jgi:ammonium transporter, Amt family
MPQVSAGDTAWMLMSAALVLFMTPGLALFYGGMVRSKNVLGTIMQSFFAIGLVTVLWVLVGYSLAFSPGNALIGGLSWAGLAGVGLKPLADYAPTIPHLLYMIYQGMFAIITPALITGALAERMKFKSFLVFTTLWLLLVYCPIAHWVWGISGWIKALGVLDFAGGTVVHISSGIAALAAALVIGRRKGFATEALHPHNLPMTVTGAAILWFGWFGFNAGSALSSGELATSAFVATHIAAAAATVSWVVAEWIGAGKPTTLGAASGAVAGLVAITPASGYVTPMGALAIGLVAGALCYWAVTLKFRFGYDDALDVVGVHFVGGTTGALLTGVLATKLVNPAGANGLLAGNPALLGTQAIAVVATIAFSFTVSFVLLKVIDAVMGLRVSEEDEDQGLDVAEHAEHAYDMV